MTKVLSGDPQRSVLGPLFNFIIYINDLPNNIASNIKLYANSSYHINNIDR